MLINCKRLCYDVTLKLYLHHVIKRVTHAVDRGHLLDGINVFDVFCSCYAVISEYVVQLLYHVNDLLTMERQMRQK